MISIREPCPPRYARPGTPPDPGPLTAPGAPLFSCSQSPRLTILCPQGALTDLTGGLGRLPWRAARHLARTQGTPTCSHGPPCFSSLLPAGRPGPWLGQGLLRVAPLTKEMVRVVWISLERPLLPTCQVPPSPAQPRPCPTRESSRRQQKGSHWFLLDPPIPPEPQFSHL